MKGSSNGRRKESLPERPFWEVYLLFLRAGELKRFEQSEGRILRDKQWCDRIQTSLLRSFGVETRLHELSDQSDKSDTQRYRAENKLGGPS
jgi:hypothetical protein